MGSANPTVFGSFNNYFSYHGIVLSINISYKFGYYFRKPTLSYKSLFNSGEGHKDFERRWQRPGDELITTIPSMIYIDNPLFDGRDDFYANSEINVFRGDHIRLNYINLRYTLIKNKRKLPFSEIAMDVNLANLGILWRSNNEKLDPDYPYVLAPGKQISLGVSAKF